MDRYTKVVLTVIAICLILLVVKGFQPIPAYSGLLDAGPTFGDYQDLSGKKGDELKKGHEQFLRGMPVVMVWKVRGPVDVDVGNTVEVEGSVDCN